MEAMVTSITWDSFLAQYKMMFKMIRAPVIGWLMLSVANIFINKMIPELVVRKLTKEEFDHYKEPFPTIKSRKPVRVWPQELPISGEPKRVHVKQVAWIKWFESSKIPKLCLYAHPGGILKDKEIEYLRNKLTNTKFADVGKGIHFIQEDNPHGIGNAILKWYKTI